MWLQAEEPLIINRPQWDTDAAMAKIRAEAMISTEEEYEKLPELQSKLRLSLISVYINQESIDRKAMDLNYLHIPLDLPIMSPPVCRCLCVYLSIYIYSITSNSSEKICFIARVV